MENPLKLLFAQLGPEPTPAVKRRRAVAAVVTIALGFVSAGYGLSVFLLGTNSHFFLFWFVLAVFFFGIGHAWYHGWLAALPRAVKAALWALLATVMLAVGLALGAVLSHADDEPPAGVDYLVVLGAQVKEDGPSAILRLRLDAAVAYLENNPATQVVVSGCMGPGEPWSEAQGMRDYLVSRGIDEGRIIMEDQAENTEQNIAYSARLIPAGASICIVTNNFHVYRSLAMARHQGLGEVYGLATGMSRFYFVNNVARESVCIIYYTLMGRM